MVIEKSPHAFRTISEASEILSLPSHVLRFWESKFKQIKPLKRAGGRRFYRPNDILFIFGIKTNSQFFKKLAIKLFFIGLFLSILLTILYYI